MRAGRSESTRRATTTRRNGRRSTPACGHADSRSGAWVFMTTSSRALRCATRHSRRNPPAERSKLRLRPRRATDPCWGRLRMEASATKPGGKGRLRWSPIFALVRVQPSSDHRGAGEPAAALAAWTAPAAWDEPTRWTAPSSERRLAGMCLLMRCVAVCARAASSERDGWWLTRWTIKRSRSTVTSTFTSSMIGACPEFRSS